MRGREMGTNVRRPRKKASGTSRGPQGLPIQASSQQRPAPSPRPVSRPAPRVQPGPIRAVERPRIARQTRRNERLRAEQDRVAAARQQRLSAALGSPIEDLRAQSRAKVERAQSRAPERPLPSTPILRNPTRAQIQATKDLFARSLAGQSRGARHAQDVSREIETDPRSRAKLAPLRAVQAAEDARLTDTPRERFRHNRWLNDVARLGLAQAKPRPRQQIAGLDVSGAAGVLRDVRSAVAANTSLGSGTAEAQFVRNALRNAKDIVTMPAVVSWETSQALLEAAKDVPGLGAGIEALDEAPVVGTVIPEGRGTGRARRLAEGMAEGVLDSVPLRLARGDFEGAGQETVDNPLFTLLDLTGVGSVVGRTAGGVARALGTTSSAGGVRGAAARLGSTVRPAVALTDDPGSRLVKQRERSRNMAVALVQDAMDRRREPMVDSNGRPVTVPDARSKDEVPVLKSRDRSLVPGRRTERERLQENRINMVSDRANSVERLDREQAAQLERAVAAGTQDEKGLSKAARTLARQPRGKKGDVLPLVVTGVVRNADTFEVDLRKESRRVHARLDDPGTRWRSQEERATAQERVEMIDKVLGSNRAMARTKQLYESGTMQARALNVMERELQGAGGSQSPAAMRRARLMEWAQAHMGARRVDVDEHAKMERAGKDAEAKAFAALRETKAGTPERQAALVAYDRVRAGRIAVSGRDPVKVEAHERAARQVQAARAAERTAVGKARVLRAKLDRASGASAAGRGRDRGQVVMRAAREQPTRARGVTAYIDEVLGNGEASARAAAREARRGQRVGRLREQVQAANERARAARRARQKAEKQLRGNQLPPIQPGLRREDGSFLRNEDIEADIRRFRGEDGLDTVAYLEQRLSRQGERADAAFHKRGDMNRPVVEKAGQSRTGAMFERGAVAIGRDTIRREFADKATTLAKIRQVDRFIHDAGMRNPAVRQLQAKAKRGEELTRSEQALLKRGGLMTEKQALELADRLRSDTGVEWVPVRSFRSSLPTATQKLIREDRQNPAVMQDLGSILLNDRIVQAAGKSRAANVVLVPAPMMQELAEQLQRAGQVEMMLQALNRPFRMAVLPQPRWLTGNFTEPYLIRLTVNGSGLNVAGLALDIRAGVKVLRHMENHRDPKVRLAAQEVKAQRRGGLFLGRRGNTNRRVAEDFRWVQRLVRSMGPRQRAVFLRSLPVMRSMKDALLWPLDQIFRANRELIEKWAQTAADGHKFRQDLHAFYGSWIKAQKLGHDALEQAARGQVDTATQHRFLEAQHEILGQYGAWGPTMRKLTQGPLPFIPWMLNALRFTLWTMPAKHPALTSLLMQGSEFIEESWDDAHEPGEVPPGVLRYAARESDGGLIDFARYTPWSAPIEILEGLEEGKPFTPITDQFMPQLSGFVAAGEGRDPFGRQLSGPDEKLTDEGKVKPGWVLLSALNQLFESSTPYVSQARRAAEGGGTAYSTSTIFDRDVKPDTDYMSGARRTFDPFRPTYIDPPAPGSFEDGYLPGARPGKRRAPARRVRSAPRSVEEARLDRLVSRQRSRNEALDTARLERLARGGR